MYHYEVNLKAFLLFALERILLDLYQSSFVPQRSCPSAALTRCAMRLTWVKPAAFGSPHHSAICIAWEHLCIPL
jgi:hypothetical protein